jgi:succinyl-diaminopimelate desuccinylase
MGYQEAFARIEKNQEFLIDTLRRMVRVNTSNPPGLNYDRLADVTEPIFKSFGFKTERVISPFERIADIKLPLQGDRVNLVATKETGRPPVTIYAHMDVVPAEGKWTHDPFGGEVSGGKIWGRGTLDMKGEAACLLNALKVMNDLGVSPVFDLNVLFCTDEEIGFYPGVYYLAQRGYVKGHVMWLETGSQEPLQAGSSAGMLDTEITITGKSAHSGRNWAGVNAIEEAIPILDELYALKKKIQSRPSADKSRMTENGLVPLTGLFNIDIIRAGVKSNIVPDTCTIVTNRRYLSEEKYEEVVKELDGAIARGRQSSRALDVKVEHRHCYRPVVIDTNTTCAIRARKVRGTVHGWDPDKFTIVASSGSIDMGFALEPTGITGVASFGSRRTYNTTGHGVDEYCAIDELVNLSKEIYLYLTMPL